MTIEENIELKLKKPIHPRLCPPYIVIPINIELQEDKIHDLTCLNSILKDIGISLSLKRKKMDDYTCDLLCISFNSDTFIRKTKRNAGRHMDANKHGKYKECSVTELNNMLNTMRHREIIEELKCPRATFYRILKTLRELDDWDNNPSSIWFYTT